MDRSLVQLVDDTGRRPATGCSRRSAPTPATSSTEAGEAAETRDRHLDYYVALRRAGSTGLRGGRSARLAGPGRRGDRQPARCSGLEHRLCWSGPGRPHGRDFSRCTCSRAATSRSDAPASRRPCDGPRRDEVDLAGTLGALCIVCYRAGDMVKAARLRRRGGCDRAPTRRCGHAGPSSPLARVGPVLGRCRPAGWRGPTSRKRQPRSRQTDDQLFQALNLAVLAWSYVDTSEATAPERCSTKAWRSRDVVNVPHARCYCLLVRGTLDMLEGGSTLPTLASTKPSSWPDAIGDHYAELFARGFLAYTHLFGGRYTDSRDLCERGLRAALDNRSPMGEAFMRMALGHLAFAEGALEAADGAARSLRFSSSSTCGRVPPRCVAPSRRRLPRHGRSRPKQASAPRTHSVLPRRPTRSMRSRGHSSPEASLAQLEGDPHRAEDLLHEALELAQARRAIVFFMGDSLEDLAAAVADQESLRGRGPPARCRPNSARRHRLPSLPGARAIPRNVHRGGP